MDPDRVQGVDGLRGKGRSRVSLDDWTVDYLYIAALPLDEIRVVESAQRLRAGGRPLRACTNHRDDPWQTAAALTSGPRRGSRLVALFGPQGVLVPRPTSSTPGDIEPVNQPAADLLDTAQAPVPQQKADPRHHQPRDRSAIVAPQLKPAEVDFVRSMSAESFVVSCARLTDRAVDQVLADSGIPAGTAMGVLAEAQLKHLRERVLASKPPDYVWATAIVRNMRSTLRRERESFIQTLLETWVAAGE